MSNFEVVIFIVSRKITKKKRHAAIFVVVDIFAKRPMYLRIIDRYRFARVALQQRVLFVHRVHQVDERQYQTAVGLHGNIDWTRRSRGYCIT